MIKFCENCYKNHKVYPPNVREAIAHPDASRFREHFFDGFILIDNYPENICPICKNTKLKVYKYSTKTHLATYSIAYEYDKTNLFQFLDIIENYPNLSEQAIRKNIEIYNERENKRREYRARIREENDKKFGRYNTPKIPICPKCKSTAITTGARGVSGFWGAWGASKTVNRCGYCGHTWTPRA